MSKLTRQSDIRAILSEAPVANQDELRRRLYKRGHRVTQATLSRDIHELGLVKTNDGYVLPEDEEHGADS
jgi:transcriptional regulator of arginine metabolism